MSWLTWVALGVAAVSLVAVAVLVVLVVLLVSGQGAEHDVRCAVELEERFGARAREAAELVVGLDESPVWQDVGLPIREGDVGFERYEYLVGFCSVRTAERVVHVARVLPSGLVEIRGTERRVDPKALFRGSLLGAGPGAAWADTAEALEVGAEGWWAPVCGTHVPAAPRRVRIGVVSTGTPGLAYLVGGELARTADLFREESSAAEYLEAARGGLVARVLVGTGGRRAV